MIANRITVLPVFISLVCALSAKAVTIDCEVPLNVQCTVSDPRGIERVIVRIPTAQGPGNIVDETFDCQAEVTVSWDPIVPNSEITATPCNNDLTLSDVLSGPPQQASTFHLNDDGALRVKNSRSLKKHRLPARPGLGFAAFGSLRIVKPSGKYAKPRVFQTRPDILALPDGGETAASTYCCKEGTLTGCFSVNPLAQCGEGLDFVSCPDDEDDDTGCRSFPN